MESCWCTTCKELEEVSALVPEKFSVERCTTLNLNASTSIRVSNTSTSLTRVENNSIIRNAGVCSVYCRCRSRDREIASDSSVWSSKSVSSSVITETCFTSESSTRFILNLTVSSTTRGRLSTSRQILPVSIDDIVCRWCVTSGICYTNVCRSCGTVIITNSVIYFISGGTSICASPLNFNLANIDCESPSNSRVLVLFVYLWSTEDQQPTATTSTITATNSDTSGV